MALGFISGLSNIISSFGKGDKKPNATQSKPTQTKINKPQPKEKEKEPQATPTSATRVKKGGPSSPLFPSTGVESVDNAFKSISKSLGDIKVTLGAKQTFEKEENKKKKQAMVTAKRRTRERRIESGVAGIGILAALKKIPGMNNIFQFFLNILIGGLVLSFIKNFEKIKEEVTKVTDKIRESIEVLNEKFIEPMMKGLKAIVGPIVENIAKFSGVPDFEAEENTITENVLAIGKEIPLIREVIASIEELTSNFNLNLADLEEPELAPGTEPPITQAPQQQEQPQEQNPFRNPNTGGVYTGPQPQPQQPQQPRSPGGGGGSQQTPTRVPKGKNKDFWTLVAVAAREDSDPQAWADIAQSIYNRKKSGVNFMQKDNSISGYVLGNGQYEPTWKFPRRGATGVPNKEWDQINDAKSAAKATGLSVKEIQRVAAAIRNPTLQKNARQFVGGRTDFMGGNEVPRFDKGDVRRQGASPNNFFGWFVGGGGQQRAASRSAAAIPSFGGVTDTAPPIQNAPQSPQQSTDLSGAKPGGSIVVEGDGSGWGGKLYFKDGTGKRVGPAFNILSGQYRKRNTTQAQRRNQPGSFNPMPDGTYPLIDFQQHGKEAIGYWSTYINPGGNIGSRGGIMLHSDLGAVGTAGCIGVDVGGQAGSPTEQKFLKIYKAIMPKNISVNLMGSGASSIPDQSASPQAQVSDPPINNAPQNITTNRRGRKIVVPLPAPNYQKAMQQTGVQMSSDSSNSRASNANIYLQASTNRKLYSG